MPSSPALRCSPGRELRGEKHRRWRSVEHGMLFRERDDDLTLFSEMQNKERESFLLQSSDELEDAFSSKLKHFSDFTIPIRGESSELLNADGDKNDYDWLLTPPDTPLFPSLDDEPPSAGSGSRGRPRSQISLSRSSTMEKSHRSSKGSASPNRLSTSPRSGSTHQIRGRASPARHPSPTPSLRPATPVRRLSPSPSKPSTPASRSSTPDARRMSSGSGTMVSSGVRAASPVRSKRGNSASPKIKAWQSNIPGFSLDAPAPPNLRTSLADRPASYVRGSSPASRNGRDSTSRQSRQSVSPTATRSVSSSHSRDRDRFSSHSKGSVASSGDDDLDSLQSIPLGGSDRPVSRRASLSPNNRTLRSSKLLSSSSAPKRSFETALRQMDHRKSHQNMFRPLVSSVPSTGFYTGKGSSSYHHIILRHSSGATGENASFDPNTGFMPDTGECELLHVSQTESVKLPYLDKHEESSAFGEVDPLNVGDGHERHGGPLNKHVGDLDQDSAVDCEPGVPEEIGHHVINTEVSPTSGRFHVTADISEAVALETIEVCSKCGCQYLAEEAVKQEISLCPHCREQHNFVDNTIPGATILADNSPKHSMKAFEETRSLVEINSAICVAELLQKPFAKVEAGAVQTQENVERGQNSNEQEQDHLQHITYSRSPVEGDVERPNHQYKLQQPSSGRDLLNSDTKGTEMQLSDEHHGLKFDPLEGGEVAVLIERSSCMKSPIIQGKNHGTVIKPYEELSYSRERSNSFRSSTGHGSASASSSVDYGSFRHTDTRVQWHLSGKTSDIESHRYDISSKSLSSVSSLSGVSSHAIQALSVAARLEDSSMFAANMTCANDRTLQEPQSEMQASGSKEDDAMNTASGESSKSVNISTTELSSNVVEILAEDNSVVSLHNDDNKCSYVNGDGADKNVSSTIELGDSTIHARSASEIGASPVTVGGSFEEQAVPPSLVDNEKDEMEVPGNSSTAATSEIELESSEHETLDSKAQEGHPRSGSNANEFEDCSGPCSPKKDTENCAMEHSSSAHSNGILDESTVLVKRERGREAKSLTLEEATDTILFCSSIVHDIAYQAATIASEKLNDVPVEDSRPTVTVLGKSNTDRGYTGGRSKTKRSSKSANARHNKQTETNAKACSQRENDENAGESVIRNVEILNKGDRLNPPKLDSKCNCSIM